MEAYDYIVVGAGTAGCVLAARLSENPAARVLLLEAGSAGRTRAMTVPNAWPENLGSAADWGYVTTGQAGAGPLPYPRGRTLGGSGAINAMAHVRGHRAIYDRWAEVGAPGRGSDDLLPFFRMTERADRRDPVLRGTDGPIRVAPAEAGRHPVARAFGVGYVRDGVSAGALADTAAGGEVILAAGAIGSPHLLLRSGIGPAGDLRTLGIDPVADLAGVGANLQDHPTAKACCATSAPLPASRYNYGETYAALRSDLADEVPDLHRLAAGLAMVRRVTAQASFAEAAGEAAELYPGPEIRTDTALRDYIRRTVDSYYHPVGTCRMGSGDGAVVDPDLRVRGVAGLRVADASVMPLIPNAHPHATVLAVAERAAALITAS